MLPYGAVGKRIPRLRVGEAFAPSTGFSAHEAEP